jgi:hypothetical protein
VVAAHGDDPLDELVLLHHRAPGLGGGEDDDLAAFGLREVVDEFVDEHPVVDEKGLLHRLGRDVERLQDEGPHHHGDDDGQFEAPLEQQSHQC